MIVTKEFIEKNWPLTEVEIQKIPKQGMAGQVGIVISKEGKYTYKIAGSWKSPESLDRDLSAYDFLLQQNFRYISNLLKTKEQKKFIQQEKNLIYLIQYIEGDHPAFIPETYKEIGKIMADLHSIPNFPFESDYRPESAIRERMLHVGELNLSFEKEYLEVIQHVRSFNDLTKVLLHTELTPGNVIQKQDGNIIAIDWDEVGTGPAVLDLGVGLINHFITDDLEIKHDNARAFYETYFSLCPLGNHEKQYIWDAGLYYAWLWIPYGDLEKRWKKILFALENKSTIEALYA